MNSPIKISQSVIINFWIFEKNNLIGLDPDKIGVGSHKKAFLRCLTCGCEKFSIIREFLTNGNCKKCGAQKRIATFISRYGVENPMKVESIKRKVEQTCIEIYGTKHPSQTTEVKDKTKATWAKNYKEGHPLRDAEVQNKRRKACLEIYGVDNPMRNQEVKEKSKKTCRDRYGVDYSLQNKEVRERIYETCKKIFGVDNTFKSKEVQNSIANTMMDKYGVKHPSQNSTISLKQARSANKITDIPYWKNNEPIPCHGSYEVKTVGHWNSQKEEFRWQIVFKIPKNEPIIGGKTYRVDAYLPDKDLYIEIKGRFYDEEARLKWEWFHRTYPNSELWNKKKLKSLGII